jgi:hypothetical protein
MATRSGDMAGRLSLSRTIPPDRAVAVARVLTSSRVRRVVGISASPTASVATSSRARRQSGSLSQSRRWHQKRVRTLRSAFSTAGKLLAGRPRACRPPGVGTPGGTRHQIATSGPRRMPSTSPTEGAMGAPQPNTKRSPTAPRTFSRPRR